MTILVAGGSGLVGSAIIRELERVNKKVIGISSKDERLNDFIINIAPDQIKIFKNELIKYLKVFNKI